MSKEYFTLSDFFEYFKLEWSNWKTNKSNFISIIEPISHLIYEDLKTNHMVGSRICKTNREKAETIWFYADETYSFEFMKCLKELCIKYNFNSQ
jgi:hypothetical protein